MANLEKRKTSTGNVRWRVRWRDGGGRDGDRESVTFDDETEAARFRSLVEGYGETWPPGFEHLKPIETRTDGNAPTVREFLDEWAAMRPGVERRTLGDDRRTVEWHVLPDFGDRHLDDISRGEIARWLVTLERANSPKTGKPYSTSRMNNIRSAFASLMDIAVTAGHRPDNPVRGHRHVRRDRDGDSNDEMVFLTGEEFQLIANHLPAGRVRDFATLLIFTGLRYSEATALQIGDIDLLASPPQLRVRRAWKASESRAPSDYYLGAPKTRRGRRTVTLPDDAVEALLPHVTPDERPADALVFPNKAGNMWHDTSFHHYYWKPALKAAKADGLAKRPRIHDLRHSHVSWLIAAGRPPLSISRRLGHESIQVTMDKYGHLMPEVDTEDLDALNAVLKGTRK